VIEAPAVTPAGAAIVIDSTSYMPRELIDSQGIRTVSLYVRLQDEQRPESEIHDLDDFYERLRASGESVATSQPSVGDFVSVYEPLLDQGHEIVSIHLSANISGTYESALQARERLTAEGKGGERIEVMDSRTGCGALGLLALAAAAEIEGGGDAKAAVERAQKARESLKIWFAVDTLEYLRRGGRIGAARALIGSTLKIKPILTLEDEITPIERVRTRARSVERLVDYARQRHADGADAWVVQHVQDAEAAARLGDECRGVFGRDPVFASEIGPVIGAHVGPGLLGVGAIAIELLEP
jgi:DegV family protein with EDD domain